MMVAPSLLALLFPILLALPTLNPILLLLHRDRCVCRHKLVNAIIIGRLLRNILNIAWQTFFDGVVVAYIE